jgi:hypothetical protein
MHGSNDRRYSITSSAATCRGGGTVSLSALAVSDCCLGKHSIEV